MWLDELVSGSYELGSSHSIDVSAEVEGWTDWDALEKEQALKLLLLCNVGESKITNVGAKRLRSSGQRIRRSWLAYALALAA